MADLSLYTSMVNEANDIEQIAIIIETAVNPNYLPSNDELINLLKPILVYARNADTLEEAEMAAENIKKSVKMIRDLFPLRYLRDEEDSPLDMEVLRKTLFDGNKKAKLSWIGDLWFNSDLVMLPFLIEQTESTVFETARAAQDRIHKILMRTYGTSINGEDAAFLTWLTGTKFTAKYFKELRDKQINPAAYPDSQLGRMLAESKPVTDELLKNKISEQEAKEKALAVIIEQVGGVERLANVIADQSLGNEYRMHGGTAETFLKQAEQARREGDTEEYDRFMELVEKYEAMANQVVDRIAAFEKQIIADLSAYPPRIKDQYFQWRLKTRFDTEKAKAETNALAGEIMPFLDNLVNNSPISDQQAQEWVNGVNILPNALRALANTYPTETLHRDMKTLYRLVGGNIKNNLTYVYDGPRAYANEYGQLNVGRGLTKKVHWHELGHHIEYANKDLLAAAKQLLTQRSIESDRKGAKVKSLRKLTGINYRSNEKAVDDHFYDFYVGKIYSFDGSIDQIYATEVISMGIESMATPEGAAKLAITDRGHFDFMVWVMQTLNKRGANAVT